MKSKNDWLPGCYRNLPIKTGESLPGYLLRLAEANGYAGIRHLLLATDLWESTSGYSFRLRTRPELLTTLGRMAIGDPRHLENHDAKELKKSAAFIFRGCTIDTDAILHDRAQVCPLCLGEDGIVKEEFELATVTVCSTHRVQLIDECPACRHPLDWKRSHLMACERCGADFRSNTVIAVDAQVCEVADDFAALAPFRIAGLNGKTETEEWDMMFRVFKALALSDSDWASMKWPKWVVQLLPVNARHEIVKQLAQVRQSGSYLLSGLQGKVQSALAPLTAIPRPFVLENCALKLLTDAWLPRELAEALCSTQPVPREISGAELFHGRPPSLRTPEEMLLFLATDWKTVQGLIARKILGELIDSDLGYDIDELLAAQQFLHTGALTLSELAIVVGVPLDWEDLVHSSLIRPWNPRNPSDMRVAVDDVLLIQQRLTENWSANGRPDRAIKLRDIAMRTERPFQTVSEAVMLASRGELGPYGWTPPYDWGSLMFTEDEGKHLSER